MHRCNLSSIKYIGCVFLYLRCDNVSNWNRVVIKEMEKDYHKCIIKIQ